MLKIGVIKHLVEVEVYAMRNSDVDLIKKDEWDENSMQSSGG